MKVKGATDPDELFVSLLISPRYRIVRHALLALFAVTLFIGNIYVGFNVNRGWLLAVSGLILVPFFLNVYVLVPRLLLRNRPYAYLSVTAVIVLSVLILSTYIQYRLSIPSAIYKEDYGSILKYVLLSNFSTAISFSLMIAGTTSLIILQLWLRERKKIGELEEASAIAELEMLKNQINPHFLFNMLNNAIVLVREGSPAAGEVIMKLRELLDYQLEQGHAGHVALSEEIGFLDDLLQLEQIRRDNFDYRILVTGNAAGIKVPPMMFIPFVENAVKHGNDTRDSYILLIFNVEPGRIHFFCSNSVPVLPAAGSGGLGLKNIRRRLELIYGKEHSLHIGGTDRTYNVNLTIAL